MPKGNELSEFERGEIIGLKKANFSYREIANILNRSKTAVENTVNDYMGHSKSFDTINKFFIYIVNINSSLQNSPLQLLYNIMPILQAIRILFVVYYQL